MYICLYITKKGNKNVRSVEKSKKICIMNIVIEIVKHRQEIFIMKKTWVNAAIEELDIQATAGGEHPNDDFDGPWQQLDDGKWWRPGGDAPNKMS